MWQIRTKTEIKMQHVWRKRRVAPRQLDSASGSHTQLIKTAFYHYQ